MRQNYAHNEYATDALDDDDMVGNVDDADNAYFWNKLMILVPFGVFSTQV